MRLWSVVVFCVLAFSLHGTEAKSEEPAKPLVDQLRHDLQMIVGGQCPMVGGGGYDQRVNRIRQNAKLCNEIIAQEYFTLRYEGTWAFKLGVSYALYRTSEKDPEGALVLAKGLRAYIDDILTVYYMVPDKGKLFALLGREKKVDIEVILSNREYVEGMITSLEKRLSGK